MKKIATIYFGVMILLVIIMVFLVKSFLDNIREQEAEIARAVGNQVIIKKDTLTITDYSIFDSTYQLDNGIDIGMKYYDKLKEKGQVIE